MIGAAIMGVVGLATTAVGGMNAQSAAKKAAHTRAAQERIQAQRQTYQQIRESRIKRAQIVQSAANSGTSDSSGAQSGAAGVTSSGFKNIGFINAQESLGLRLSSAQQSMSDAQGLQTLGQGMFDLAGSVAKFSPDIKAATGGFR